MIFVTIGTQEPFDRLIKAIDEVAKLLPNERIVAQVIKSEYKVRNIETVGFISPQKFDELLNEADLVIGHAGMGTVISALTQNKPLVILPRKLSLGEHRNDHQMATAKKMHELGYVDVVFAEEDLKRTILEIKKKSKVNETILNNWASPTLISSLREFILNN